MYHTPLSQLYIRAKGGEGTTPLSYIFNKNSPIVIGLYVKKAQSLIEEFLFHRVFSIYIISFNYENITIQEIF